MCFYSSPHVHTQYCDGRSTASDMARAAREHGFVSLGFSSHGAQAFDPKYCMSREGEQAYIAETARLCAQYAGSMKMWTGVERDALALPDAHRYAYVIGSAHYLPYEGKHIPVDGDRDKLLAYVRDALHGDGLALARRFYQLAGEYIAGYRPDIIGHFDLVRKYNPAFGFFDTSSPAYRRIALDALERAFTGCTLLEVNTGCIARGHASIPYPEPFILAHWKRLGGDVIAATDCHDAKDIAFGFDIARQCMHSAGFDSALRLGTGDALFERIDC